jgi:hypothetical protein
MLADPLFKTGRTFKSTGSPLSFLSGVVRLSCWLVLCGRGLSVFGSPGCAGGLLVAVGVSLWSVCFFLLHHTRVSRVKSVQADLTSYCNSVTTQIKSTRDKKRVKEKNFKPGKFRQG